MSEGKTNRIASLTAKSLKNLFGGDEEETCQHVGEGTPPQQATCGDTLTLGRDKDRTGRGAPERAGVQGEASPRKQNPQSSALPAPLMPQDLPCVAFSTVHSTRKSHGALRGSRRIALEKSGPNLSKLYFPISDRHQQP